MPLDYIVGHKWLTHPGPTCPFKVLFELMGNEYRWLLFASSQGASSCPFPIHRLSLSAADNPSRIIPSPSGAGAVGLLWGVQTCVGLWGLSPLVFG